MKRLAFFTAFLCSAVQAAWATPVGNVYFAEQWLEKYGADYGEKEKEAFILGALFPDIRFLPTYLNNSTFPGAPDKGVDKDSILSAKTPFESGRMLHYYLQDIRDECRAEYSSALLSEVPEEGGGLFLELLEDQILGDAVNKAYYEANIQAVIDDEKALGGTEYTLSMWHKVLRQYFGMAPVNIVKKLRQFNLGLFGVSRQTIAVWSDKMPTLAQTEEAQQYVNSMRLTFYDRL